MHSSSHRHGHANTSNGMLTLHKYTITSTDVLSSGCAAGVSCTHALIGMFQVLAQCVLCDKPSGDRLL